MSVNVSSLWRRIPHDAAERFDGCLDRAIHRNGIADSINVFFRADDIAVNGEKFDRLMRLFLSHRTPLCLAVVPAWMTKARWRVLKRYHRKASSLWCWHQHGWRHVDHQESGKKAEFGDSRGAAALQQDIVRGRNTMETLMGRDFYPVFTPPWNRCGMETLKILKNLGYFAVSRGRQRASETVDGMIEFSVDVDLHTRKMESASEGWGNFFKELDCALSKKVCGIMIHHQRMNETAFDFLEFMLSAFKSKKKIRIVNFQNLAGTVVESQAI